MIQIIYQLWGEQEERELELSFEEYYDPLEEGESFVVNGVERSLDPRDYVEAENETIRKISVKSLNDLNEIEYGKKGSLTQHTTYHDGSEMLVVQSEIDTGVIHSVKLEKPSNGNWHRAEICLIYDHEGKLVDLS